MKLYFIPSPLELVLKPFSVNQSGSHLISHLKTISQVYKGTEVQFPLEELGFQIPLKKARSKDLIIHSLTSLQSRNVSSEGKG